MEHTLALIKPDAVRRRLAGEILSIIEESTHGKHEDRFEIVQIRMIDMSIERARWFYGRQHKGRPYFEELCRFMTTGPSVAIILKMDDAIQHWRYLMGPSSYTGRQPHQIRTMYQQEGSRLMENLVHGSDSVESFQHETLALGFYPWDYPQEGDL